MPSGRPALAKAEIASTVALKLLKSAKSGFVHSVFERTVNVKVGESIVSFTTELMLLAPFSVMVNLQRSASFKELELKPGESIAAHSRSIALGSRLVEDLAGTEAWRSNLSAIQSPVLVPKVAHRP